MPDNELIILGALAVGLAVVMWLLGWLDARNKRFRPTNDLERLMVKAGESSGLTSQMCKLLARSRLLALSSNQKPGEIMPFSAKFHGELARDMGEQVDPQSDVVEFGPWILCFSSQRVVDLLADDPVLGPLVTQLGSVREYSGKEVFEAALDEEIDVALNPFAGISRRFTRVEIKKILEMAKSVSHHGDNVAVTDK